MEYIYIIVLLLILINLYLVYKTRNLENLSVELPSVETFADELNTLVINTHTRNMNEIKKISNIAYSILRERDNISIPANNLYLKDLIVEGSMNIKNKDSLLVNIFPKYMILAWASRQLPLGWALCDGKKYKLNIEGIAVEDITGDITPDLRGRFILGSGIGKNNTEDLTERKQDDIGGYENHILTIPEIPPHTHKIEAYNLTTNIPENDAKNDETNMKDLNRGVFQKETRHAGGNLKSNTGTKDDGANQDYTVPAEFTTTPHNNMPPFYVLSYIMKL